MSPIMLLSSDKELARVLKSAIQGTSVRLAYEVSTQRAAADIIAQHPVGLVVLDMFVAGSSGLEALKILKQVSEGSLFLLLTRMRTRAVLERAFRLGAQEVLHYPVGMDILRDTILHRLANQPLGDAEDSGSEHTPKPRKK